MGEPDQVKWRGIRPTDPAEDIPISLDGELITPGPPSGVTWKYDSGSAFDSQHTLWQVPAGKTLYVVQAQLSVLNYGPNYEHGQFYYTNDAGTTQLIFAILWVDAFEKAHIDIPFPMCPPIPELSRMRVISGGPYTKAAVAFWGYYL